MALLAGCAGRPLGLHADVEDLAVARDLGVATVPDLSASIDLAVAFDAASQPDTAIADAAVTLVCAPAPRDDVFWGLAADNVSISRVAIDHHGAAIVVGSLQGATTFAGVSLTSAKDTFGDPSSDVFLAKLDASGSLIFAKLIGNGALQVGSDVAVDDDDNLYVAGFFYDSFDIPGSPPGHLSTGATSAGPENSFVLKLDPSGEHLWSQRFGVTGSGTAPSPVFAQLYNVSVDDRTGDVVASGRFGGGITLPSGDASGDGAFVVRMNAAGTPLWSQAMTASEGDLWSQALDVSGNVFVGGDFEGTLDTTGAGNTSGPGVLVGNACCGSSGWIAELSPTGSVIWSVLAPAPTGGTSGVTKLAVDDNGHLIVGESATVKLDSGFDSVTDVSRFTLPSETPDFLTTISGQSSTGLTLDVNADGTLEVAVAAWNGQEYMQLSTLDGSGTVTGNVYYQAEQTASGLWESAPYGMATRGCERMIVGRLRGTIALPGVDGGVLDVSSANGGGFLFRIAP
jgi:hypothetical protein